MTGIAKPSDKEILRKIMSEPTFKAVQAAARREHEARKQAPANALKGAEKGMVKP